MNKKFSTLVAALLVSGLGFALVSSFNGLPLSDSPVAKAATASLRVLPEASQNVLLLKESFNAADKWNVVQLGTGKFVLSTVGITGTPTCYLNPNLLLTDKIEEAASLELDASKTYLTIGGQVLVARGGALTLCANMASLMLGDVPFSRYSAESTPVAGTAIAAAQDLAIAEAFTAWTGTEQIARASVAENQDTWSLQKTETAGVAFPAAELTVVTNQRVAGKYFLRVAENAYATGVVKDDEIVITNDLNSAAVLSLETTTNLVKLGDKYLSVDKDGNATLNSTAPTETDRMYAYHGNGSSTVPTADLSDKKPIYLVRGGKTPPNMGTDKGVECLCFSYETEVGTGKYPVGNPFNVVTTNTVPVFKYLTANNSLTLADSKGAIYKLGTVANATTVDLNDGLAFVGKEDKSVLTLDATDGALKISNFFVCSDAREYKALDAESADFKKVYAYKVTNGVVASISSVGTFEDGAQYVIGGKLAADAPTTLVKVNSLNYDVQAPADVKLKELTDGADYKISQTASGIIGYNFMSMKKDKDDKGYSLYNEDRFNNETASLWTVKTIKNDKGVITHYSFINKGTKELLSFNIEFNGEVSKPYYKAPAFAKDGKGKYTQFFVDDKNRISFVANEHKTFEGKLYSETSKFALNFNDGSDEWTAKVYDENTQKLAIELADVRPVALDAAIDWLNVKAGSGSDFGLVFKDENGKNVLKVEANDLTKQSLVAVQGPKVTGHAELQEMMFFKVSGDYVYNPGAVADAQLESFRASEFIIVDDAIYSDIVVDQSKLYKYAIVKGSTFISKKGYIASDSPSKENWILGKDGVYAGLSRRIENAVFAMFYNQGATIGDPIYLAVNASFKKQDMDVYETGVRQDNIVFPTIKKFNGLYYVGAYDKPYGHVYVGNNNDVDYTKVNGIVNIYSANYKTEGQIFANVKADGEMADGKYFMDFVVGLCAAKDVCADYPEGQFLVNYDKMTGKFLFTNRESNESVFVGTKDEPVSYGLKAVAGKANVYSVVGRTDTIKIVPATVEDKYAGYQNYNETIKHEMSDSVYTLAIQPTIEGLEKTPFYIKESHSTDHKLSMTTEKADMAKFKLVKFEDKNDTVKVSVEMYITANGTLKQDSAVAFLYTIYNADNNEYVRFNDEAGKKFFFCDPKSMVGDPKAQPLRFLLKKKVGGAYNLVAIDYDLSAKEDHKLVGKVFGASVANKLAAEENIYKLTENDLITIKPVGAPEYRKIVAAPFDTIRIYKEGLENVALYAETADKSIVSGEHFLGMTHKTEATKAHYSFFVDTAFVNRTNNNKYQYLLVLDADTVHGKVPCSDPTHAPHDSGRIDTVYGKFLVNAEDSIASWGTKHNNPYFWETAATPKLAFVNAAHIGDSLIIKSSMFTGNKKQMEVGKAKTFASNDTINLKKGLTKASFAFRIVDQATGSFVIETANDHFIKWLNGTPVVVNNMNEAEVFNASKTTNKPTANEDLNTSAVTVIAGNGNVTILNAAGKTVVISNMLGQTIANTVLTSDNQTIAASGIVVVAVEGEEAVKAIIK